MAFTVVFFTILGVILFYPDPQFASFSRGFWTLVVLLTTCNSPGVYMPSFERSGFYALYFVSFVVVTVLLLMNLVLARRLTNRRAPCAH